MEQKISLTPYWLIMLALVGLGDTLYLSYFQYLNLIPTCAIGGCETVLTSVYSKFFGVPLSYIGLLYYAHMLGLALLVAVRPSSKGLALAGVLYAGVGLLLSISFELLQFFIIKALCIYCGISALTTLLLVAVALWHWKKTRV